MLEDDRNLRGFADLLGALLLEFQHEVVPRDQAFAEVDGRLPLLRIQNVSQHVRKAPADSGLVFSAKDAPRLEAVPALHEVDELQGSAVHRLHEEVVKGLRYLQGVADARGGVNQGGRLARLVNVLVPTI